MPKSIRFSVGRGGQNVLPQDVMTVQYLLNCVPPSKGGPSTELVIDGIVGPKTMEAIANFQRGGLSSPDGRVDPGGPTLSRLQAFDPYPGQPMPPIPSYLKSPRGDKQGDDPGMKKDPWGAKQGYASGGQASPLDWALKEAFVPGGYKGNWAGNKSPYTPYGDKSGPANPWGDKKGYAPGGEKTGGWSSHKQGSNPWDWNDGSVKKGYGG